MKHEREKKQVKKVEKDEEKRYEKILRREKNGDDTYHTILNALSFHFLMQI